MKRLFADMNPTLRAFLILLVITGAIVALRLEATLSVLLAVLRILFIVAIAFFVYLLWRERRGEIATWSLRARTVFYGAAVLMVVDLAVEWWLGSSGFESLAFFAVLVLCGFAMWRVWRDQHTWV
jgi:O-antigen/teichoic acid export membrane protein